MNVPYANYTWVQNATGLFDVSVGFTYQSSWTTTYIALFTASLNAAALNSDTLCTSQASTFINGYSTSYQAVQLYGVNLVAGQTYTVVGSGSTATSFSSYGFTVVPSRITPATFLATGFNQPESGVVTTCEADTSYTNQSFVASAFTAGANNYKALLSLAALSSSYYSAWSTASSNYLALFVYNGNNVGSSSAAPATCPVSAPLISSETSLPVSLVITPGQQYSAVGSYWANGGDSGYGQFNAWLVYSFTGAPAGNIDTSSGSSGSTGSGSQTTGQTIGGQTHGGTGSTTNYTNPTTTSSSTMVACSFVFVVLAIMAIMF